MKTCDTTFGSDEYWERRVGVIFYATQLPEVVLLVLVLYFLTCRKNVLIGTSFAAKVSTGCLNRLLCVFIYSSLIFTLESCRNVFDLGPFENCLRIPSDIVSS